MNHFCRSLLRRCKDITLVKKTEVASTTSFRFFSERAEEHDEEDGAVETVEDIDTGQDAHRTILYPESSDPVLQSIAESSSPFAIIKVVSELNKIHSSHAAQAVVSLWDNKKQLHFLGYMEPKETDFYTALEQNLLPSELDPVLCTIREECTDLSDDALTSVLMSLKRLLLIHTPVYNNVLTEASFRCETFSLKPLSKFLVGLSQAHNVSLPYQSIGLVQMIKFLEECETEDNLKSIATGLIRVLRLASPYVVETFKEKCLQILSKDSDFHNLLRCLIVLVHGQNHGDVHSVIKTLVSFIEPHISFLDPIYLSSVNDTIRKADFNSTTIRHIIQQRSIELIKVSTSPYQFIELLKCIATDTLPLKDSELVEDYLKTVLSLKLSKRQLLRVMHPVLDLPCQKKELLDKFWEKCMVVEDFIYCKAFIKGYSTCHGLTRYRHPGFENKFLKWCSNELHQKGYRPMTASVVGSFLIAFAGEEMASVASKSIIPFLPQFRSYSLQYLATGLHLAELNSRKQKKTLPIRLLDLKFQLLAETRARLNSCHFVSDLNHIALSVKLLTGFGGHYAELREAVLHRFLTVVETLTPNFALSLCRILSVQRYWLPEIFESLAQRVISDSELITPAGLCLFLKSCYVTGYVPEELDQFSEISNNLLNKYFNQLTGLQILQAAVSLGYFLNLNKKLIHKIFSVKFMDQLDKEINGSMAVSTPNQIRELLGTLNRILCLDFPEENIPWFHERYYRTLTARIFHRHSPFQKEVHDCLVEVLAGPEYVRSHVYTPYYYHLSFECALDSNQRPIVCSEYGGTMWGSDPVSDKLYAKSSSELPLNSQRVGIVTLNDRCFCENIPHLLGSHIIKNRHLEILDYRVVQVPYFEWNSMKLSDRKSRVEYLYNKIFDL